MNNKDLMVMLDNQLDELVSTYPELETKERAFTAWVLLHMSENDISEKDAIDAIVDGTQEKSIDAIYIPDSGDDIIILQTKYHKDPSGKGIKKNELVKLFAGVDWLLDGDLSKIDKNPKFKAKAEEFREAYYSFDYSSIKIVFAATVVNDCSKEENDEIDKTLERLSDRGAPFIIEAIPLAKLKDALISSLHRKFNISLDIKFSGKPYSYEKEKSDVRAIIGTVKGVELAEIYKNHSYRIFDINIRNFLGNVKINQSIMRTATDKNEARHFWYYNNGVTIVCDGYSFRSLEDTIVRLENAQIINGCQTVTSLYHAGKEIKDDVEIIVRIIEKKSDINFVRSVTLFANSQNAVKASDLVGTDTIQLELKRLLYKLGYYYETRRGDYKAEKDSLPPQIKYVITLKEVAQAYATTFKQLPGVAKKDTSKLFLTKKDGGFYDEIFVAQTLPEQVIVAVTILRKMAEYRKNIETLGAMGKKGVPLWLPHSDYFMAAAFYLATFDQSKKNDKKHLLTYVQELGIDKSKSYFKRYSSLVSKIQTIVAENEGAYGYSHPRFFKTQIEYKEKIVPLAVKSFKVI